MALTTVATALKILESAWKALEVVRERAQTSKDTDLKGKVNELFDEFLALKSIIVRLTDENTELRRAQTEIQLKANIRQVGETNYYFVGDEGQYCQPCYDVKGKLIPLSPRQDFAGGSGRQCRVCNNTFFEAHRRTTAAQRKPYSGRWS